MSTLCLYFPKRRPKRCFYSYAASHSASFKLYFQSSFSRLARTPALQRRTVRVQYGFFSHLFCFPLITSCTAETPGGGGGASQLRQPSHRDSGTAGLFRLVIPPMFIRHIPLRALTA